jgi:tetratricopeptide (TPR) repeat protein
VSAYTLAAASRICGVSAARLRYWQRTRLLPTRARGSRRSALEFRDLISVRALVALLDRGVPLRRIRASVESARSVLADAEVPLDALRLWPEGSGRVVVRHAGLLLEPGGQLVLDLGPQTARVAPLGRGGAAGERDAAEEWFELGCRLDSERSTWAEAVEAYLRAIQADPDFADAHCNLGSVYFNQDHKQSAQLCFERALQIEPQHVEANLNLATLLEEQGREESALHHYKVALAADPLCADTHVSLALLYQRLGLRRRAREHWRRYLQLEPGGPWADVARRHVDG